MIFNGTRDGGSRGQSPLVKRNVKKTFGNVAFDIHDSTFADSILGRTLLYRE